MGSQAHQYDEMETRPAIFHRNVPKGCGPQLDTNQRLHFQILGAVFVGEVIVPLDETDAALESGQLANVTESAKLNVTLANVAVSPQETLIVNSCNEPGDWPTEQLDDGHHISLAASEELLVLRFGYQHHYGISYIHIDKRVYRLP
jgi:hypothetical protein